MSKVKVERENNQTKISISLKNALLVIVYIIVIILLWVFLNQFNRIIISALGNDYQIFIGVLITTIISVSIAKSLFGRATITIEDGIVKIYSGVFGIGRTREFLISQLKDIFISRKVPGGGTSDGVPHPTVINQHIVFLTNKKIKFLQNKITSHDLKHLCEILKTELMNHK